MSFESYMAIYIIKPLPQLVELVQNLDSDWGFLITEPQVLSRFEDSNSADPSEIRLRDAEVKTLFLMGLRKEYFGAGTKEISRCLTRLVGLPKIDINAFNSWWYLERFDCVSDTCERLLQAIGNQYTNEICPQPDLPGYDAWIQSLPSPQ